MAGPAALVQRQGHDVGLLNCPNSIFTQQNYNSGGVVARELGKDARTAHLTVYHDAAHPSFFDFPIVK